MFLIFYSACLFLVAGSKLEATVSSFLTKELTCTGDIDRAKAIQRLDFNFCLYYISKWILVQADCKWFSSLW